MQHSRPHLCMVLDDLWYNQACDLGSWGFCGFCLFVFKDFIYLFLDRAGGRERNINVLLSLTHPQLGTWPATQACALTGNWPGDPLVHRPALNPLIHTSQSRSWVLKKMKAKWKKPEFQNPFIVVLLELSPLSPIVLPCCPHYSPVLQSIPTLLSMSMGHLYLFFN